MGRATFQILVRMACLAGLIFWPAGTVAYPGAWVSIALFGAGGFAITFWLSRHNPRLLRERMGSPVQREQAGWDRVFLTVFIVGFCGWLALMGWDAGRTRFT
jgi:hypothetical protein